MLQLDFRKNDLELFDTLGPLTRAMLDASPLNINVISLLRDFRTHRANPNVRGYDRDGFTLPIKPPTDAEMAEFVLRMIRSRFGTEWKPVREPKRRLRR